MLLWARLYKANGKALVWWQSWTIAKPAQFAMTLASRIQLCDVGITSRSNYTPLLHACREQMHLQYLQSCATGCFLLLAKLVQSGSTLVSGHTCWRKFQSLPKRFALTAWKQMWRLWKCSSKILTSRRCFRIPLQVMGGSRQRRCCWAYPAQCTN